MNIIRWWKNFWRPPGTKIIGEFVVYDGEAVERQHKRILEGGDA